MTITREQLFAATKPIVKTHKSDVFGGEIKYHLATVAERSRARKMALIGDTDKVDGEVFEAALCCLCIDEPKLQEIDLDEVKRLPGGEVNTVAVLILGKAAQSPK